MSDPDIDYMWLWIATLVTLWGQALQIQIQIQKKLVLSLINCRTLTLNLNWSQSYLPKYYGLFIVSPIFLKLFGNQRQSFKNHSFWKKNRCLIWENILLGSALRSGCIMHGLGVNLCLLSILKTRWRNFKDWRHLVFNRFWHVNSLKLLTG